MNNRTILLTSTGEPYQPVRLKWSTPGKAYCLKRLEALECVAQDAKTNELRVWHIGEAADLDYGSGPKAPPPADGSTVILGTFRFPEPKAMVLEVRSFARAIALARLLRPILGTSVLLRRVRVINRWFEAGEAAQGLAALDKHLDRNVTVIRWEDAERELRDAVGSAPTPKEREARLVAWHEAHSRKDVPLVEDFPCHPEEETHEMSALASTLNLRLVRASRHWAGEPATLGQIINELAASASRGRASRGH